MSEHVGPNERQAFVALGRAFAITTVSLGGALVALGLYAARISNDQARHYERARICADERAALEQRVAALTPTGSVLDTAAPPAIESYAHGHMVDGTMVAWPDAGNYSPERFTMDCNAVCQERFLRSDPPGRVLMVDPAHLLCVCFHPGTSSFPVTRWVAWERQTQ